MVELNDLFARISNNDEVAFMSFFDLYLKKVYNFILKFIKDKTEAEDLTQIVFIKLWEKREMLKSVTSADGFIFTMAHRVVIDHFRLTKTKHKISVQNEYLNDTKPSSLTSEDLINRHEFELIYNKALELMPPKRKEVFILSRHEGLTNKQISERLNISVKTVENQMTSALFSLKEYFKQSDFIFFIVFSIIHRL